MATFQVPIKVGKYAPVINGARDCGELEPVSALVDRDAGFSIFPESFLMSLGVEPRERTKFKRRDGSIAEYNEGTALLEIGDEQWPCPVIFGPEGRYVLGRTALSAFGLQVSPDGKRLEPAVVHLPSVIALEMPAEVEHDER
jgi:hypothetical protein